MALFRVPRVTEYALRSLGCLARSGQRMSVREISELEHIHAASLAKVLQLLCWHNLVRSQRGRRGGFWLARPPEDIRLKDVMEVFQGPFEDAANPSEPGFSAAWERVCASTREALETLTLADLLRFEAGHELPLALTVASSSGARHRPSRRRA